MPSSEVVLEPLNAFFAVVSFVLGLLVGSFANVCISRWPAGDSVVRPRSRCPKCMSPIAWYDNIPLISWLVLGARCRNCRTPISWEYPLVEAITGLLFLLVYWRFGIVLAAPVYMLLCAGMVIVTFQDIHDWTIPNQVTMPGIPIGIGLALVGMVYPESLLRVTDPLHALDGIALGAFIICFLDRATILLLKKPGMGFGDVKLLAMLGAFLGWQGVLGTLVLASFVGSIVGVSMMFLFRARALGEDDEEDEAAGEDEPVEIDPLADVVLVSAFIYLAVRISIFLSANSDYFPVDMSTPVVLGLVLLGLLLALMVAWPRLRRQEPRPAPPRRARRAGETEPDEEADTEITIEGHYLPFGPYLAMAGMLYMFIGPEAVSLYQQYLQSPLGN